MTKLSQKSRLSKQLCENKHFTGLVEAVLSMTEKMAKYTYDRATNQSHHERHAEKQNLKVLAAHIKDGNLNALIDVIDDYANDTAFPISFNDLTKDAINLAERRLDFQQHLPRGSLFYKTEIYEASVRMALEKLGYKKRLETTMGINIIGPVPCLTTFYLSWSPDFLEIVICTMGLLFITADANAGGNQVPSSEPEIIVLLILLASFMLGTSAYIFELCACIQDNAGSDSNDEMNY